MIIKRFEDRYRGNGWHISGRRWTIAFRWRWRAAFIRPPGKPGYTRIYIGPVEFEWHAKVGNL